MSTPLSMEFKVASEDWEFEQIHALNYRTFVEEIPQHEVNPSKKLIDKFHQNNTYFVCVRDRRIVGMICIHDQRPFSLDFKIDNLDSYLPLYRSICEVRLLSVDPKYRGSQVLKGLLKLLVKHGIDRGYDLAIMSGLESQQKLYRHLGWEPFGPIVGSAGARYQPMYLTLEAFATKTLRVLEDQGPARRTQPRVNLLPGPVNIPEPVRNAFVNLPMSHRSDSLVEELTLTRRRLARLTGARFVEIFMGSGTLANDVVAGQLSLPRGRGLILSNGEFGQRLVNHARGFGLDFSVMEAAWGEPFEMDRLNKQLDQTAGTQWLWAVHCETSTGVLNDLNAMAGICKRRSIRLCMDCISSIGVVPVNLDSVYLASGVSGKGLGSYSGLAMVYYNHPVHPEPERVPRCLDLGYFAARGGIPFTLSSNLLNALTAALEGFERGHSFHTTEHLSAWLRSRLREAGFKIVAPDAHSCPGIITLAIPRSIDTGELGRRLEEHGFLVSFSSEYLLERNWMQVALMGTVSQEPLEQFCLVLQSLCAEVQC